MIPVVMVPWEAGAMVSQVAVPRAAEDGDETKKNEGGRRKGKRREAEGSEVRLRMAVSSPGSVEVSSGSDEATREGRGEGGFNDVSAQFRLKRPG